MHPKSLLLIFGMALVTFLPRALPAVLIEKMEFSPRMEKFLRLIPYTAMTALIFPGLLTVDPERVEIGLLGALAAALLAWRKCPVIVCVLGAIAADLLLYLFV
ncbi:AzlD domain-containing protein [uncultured Oscillibacter sp.]|uniref:AzlD domain-containing protein n=1 Tax=uncultured Oscillibacter sp. TaxID=876091 RepID=UPI00262182B7|nr:AzlD domain-containing protein [uncultured Oscillibacter sp.]